MLEARDYHVSLKRQTGEGFVARCIELPGCLGEGKTEAEALRNIQRAIRLYLADAHAEAKKEKHEKLVQVTLWLRESSRPPSLPGRKVVRALAKVGTLQREN